MGGPSINQPTSGKKDVHDVQTLEMVVIKI